MPYSSRENRLAYNREYNRLYWKTLPNEHKKHFYDLQRARRLSHRHFMDGYKTFMGCADCGYTAHPAALDFDHVRGTKLMNMAAVASRGWPQFLLELEKCEVRCSNCHRIRHAAKDKS